MVVLNYQCFLKYTFVVILCFSSYAAYTREAFDLFLRQLCCFGDLGEREFSQDEQCRSRPTGRLNATFHTPLKATFFASFNQTFSASCLTPLGAPLFPCLLLLIAFGREGDGAGMVGLMLYEALCQLACQGRTADDEAHFSVVCDTYGALSYIRQRLASVLPAVSRPGRVPSGMKSGFLIARQAG